MRMTQTQYEFEQGGPGRPDAIFQVGVQPSQADRGDGYRGCVAEIPEHGNWRSGGHEGVLCRVFIKFRWQIATNGLRVVAAETAPGRLPGQAEVLGAKANLLES